MNPSQPPCHPNSKKHPDICTLHLMKYKFQSISCMESGEHYVLSLLRCFFFLQQKFPWIFKVSGSLYAEFYWIWRTWPISEVHYKVHCKNVLLNCLKQPTEPSPFSRLAVNKTKVIKPNLISARLSLWFESRIITFGPSQLRSHNTISSTCLL